MKKLRAIVFFIFLVSFTVSLSSCWNYRDIEQLNMVAGYAIDKSPDSQQYLVTFEIVEMESSGKETKLTSKIIESEGETLFDAIRNAIKFSGNKLFFSHNKIIIISQDVAKDGIIQIMDLLLRGHEPRIENKIIISKEKTAKEILEQNSIKGEIQSLTIYNTISNAKELSKIPLTEAYEFVQVLSSEGEAPMLPAIGIDKEKVEVSGTAIFKEDKLIGFLDEDSTKYLLFVKDMVKSGILAEMKEGESPPKRMSLEILENSTRINPIYSDGKVSIRIDVKTKVSISEYGLTINYLDEKGRQILKNNTEQSLKTNIINVIEKVQNEHNADVFGFGKSIKMHLPSVWKGISSHWEILFKNLDVNVNVQMDIKHTGINARPISIGE